MGALDELMASIVQKGLLQPIVVRAVDGGFEVIAGNRRLEACKRLKLRSIACHVVELDDKEAYEVSLTENVQRKTLNPIEEGEAFKKYVDEFGHGGVSELAKKIAKSHTYVSKRIALLALPTEVQEEIVRRRTPPSIAEELLSLDPEHAKSLSSFILMNKTTRNDVRSIVKDVNLSQEAALNASNFSHYASEEKRQHSIDRALAKYIASLKVCLLRLDDVMGYVDEDEFVVREILIYYRRFLHRHIDALLKLKKKVLRGILPLE